jgi:hypothetical protein
MRSFKYQLHKKFEILCRGLRTQAVHEAARKCLQGLDMGEAGDDVRRLRRHLAELKEIVSLDAECRAMSKGLR